MIKASRDRSDGPRAVLESVFLCLIVCASACAESPATETRALEDFHSVSAAISGDIRLEQGTETLLVIEARPETLERLTTAVEDGVLQIRETSGRRWWRNSGPIRIRISYRQLRALSLSGSADVTTDALTAREFQVRISGSSNVQIPRMTVEEMRVEITGSGDLDVDALEAERLLLEVSGSGDLALNGGTDELVAVVRGSGTVDGARLEARVADVTVSGSGDVDVWVTGTLDANISGSGDIEFRGGAEVSSRVTGSGNLKGR